jgi:hypothetical protein
VLKDPRAHEAHDVPLADRLVEGVISRWLASATAIGLAANGNPPVSEYERGVSQGIEHMAYSHLANYPYTVVPQILDELRRAGVIPC